MEAAKSNLPRPSPNHQRVSASTRIADVNNVQGVFRHGVGYDPAKVIESAKGKIGLF